MIKKFIGSYVIYFIRDLKYNLFPNAKQSKKLKNDKADCVKRRDFYASFISRGQLVFDVGANEGNRIQPLLDIGARVVAVEPQTSCQKYLRYRFGKKITIIPKGLGESDGVKSFRISNLSVLSSFSDDWIKSVKETRFKDYNWDKVVEVEITTLEKLINTYGEPVFIKIDVEGYETEVLKGLSRPIKMVSFEYTVPERTNNIIACIERLECIYGFFECNYSVGESMLFELKTWVSPAELKEHVYSSSFIKSGFGDVYIKSLSSVRGGQSVNCY